MTQAQRKRLQACQHELAVARMKWHITRLQELRKGALTQPFAESKAVVTATESADSGEER